MSFKGRNRKYARRLIFFSERVDNAFMRNNLIFIALLEEQLTDRLTINIKTGINKIKAAL